jgi:hypothetical protein
MAGLAVLSARRARVVSDDVVSELDRAADLGGALRSAHWFADVGTPVAPGDSREAWIAFHLDNASSRAEAIDWSRVYRRPFARGVWMAASVLTLVTVGLMVWPSARRLTRSVPAAAPSNVAAPGRSITLAPVALTLVFAIDPDRTLSLYTLAAVGLAAFFAGFTIKDEYNNLNHKQVGTLAMARTNQPDSAGSQFYVTVVPTPNLDGQRPPYVVFGQVIEGVDVVVAIGKVPTGTGDRPLTPVVIKTVKIDRVK